MFTYVAYGLGIHSAFPLPELPMAPASAAADLVVQYERLAFPSVAVRAAGGWLHADAAALHLRWPEVGTFRVRDGHEICVAPAAGVTDQVLRLFLLGPVLGAVLHQRGYLLLHASAAGAAAGAVAFLGASGAGKSTTAAALCQRGARLVTDDIVVVTPAAAHPVVVPGFPRLKLWADAVAALGEDPARLPRLHPDLEKYARPTATGFTAAVLPLRRVYVLAYGDTPAIERLPLQEALVELVRHSYAAGLAALTRTSATHFQQCGQLATRVPVCRLQRPRSLPDLPALARLVEDDLATTWH